MSAHAHHQRDGNRKRPSNGTQPAVGTAAKPGAADKNKKTNGQARKTCEKSDVYSEAVAQARAFATSTTDVPTLQAQLTLSVHRAEHLNGQIGRNDRIYNVKLAQQQEANGYLRKQEKLAKRKHDMEMEDVHTKLQHYVEQNVRHMA